MKRHTTRRMNASATLETLEGRTLLSAALIGNTLTVVGDERANCIVITASYTTVKTPFGLTLSVPYLNVAENGRQTYSGNEWNISAISVDARGGGDTISLASDITLPATLNGGAGNDSITGGGGDDTIYGVGGYNTLNGGPGNDTINAGDVGYVNGGPGDDLIYGGYGNDTLCGNDDNDTIFGREGNDSIYGGPGNDALRGGAGDDKLYGEAGNDGLFGGGDTDTLTGGAGNDRFLAYTYVVLKQRFWTATIADQGSNDARLGFENSPQITANFAGQSGTYTYTAGTWSSPDIDVLDDAFRVLMDATGNTRLLKKSDGGGLIFDRVGTKVETTGFTAVAWNDGSGKIYITDAGLATHDDACGCVLHEIGHNWDEEYNAAGWRAVSGWTDANMTGVPNYVKGLDVNGKWWYKWTSQFASNYARTNPNEDFAESFSAYFCARGAFAAGLTNVAAKAGFMDGLVASLL